MGIFIFVKIFSCVGRGAASDKQRDSADKKSFYSIFLW
jgi:hypothetical protein